VIRGLGLAYWMSRVSGIDARYHLVPSQKARVTTLLRALASLDPVAGIAVPAQAALASRAAA
jgi:hypothetical protein